MKKRHKMSLSHYRLFSAKMGYLVPTSCVPVLPSDSIQHSISALVRTAPMVGPTMHPVRVKQYVFFVPYRLLWNGGGQPGSDSSDSWEWFITNGPNNNAGLTPPRMTFNTNDISIGSLAHHLGMAPNTGGNVTYNAFYHRAYALVVNEFFRDQDLVNPVGFSNVGGTDTTTNRNLFQVAWDKDVFTTARQNPEKGSAVNIPVTGTGHIPGGATITEANSEVGTGNPYRINVAASPDSGLYLKNYLDGDGGADLLLPDQDVDISGLEVTIDDIRLSSALQHFAENRNRYGSRYAEMLIASFGIRPRDARLQRPELLSVGTSTLQFSEILQTAPGAGAPGQPGTGSLFGHGIGHQKSPRYRRFFDEHGVVLSLFVARPIPVYGNGVHRELIKSTYTDWYQPELAAIGQQGISVAELNAAGSRPFTDLHGYQDRYYEYRQHINSVAGDFYGGTNDLSYLHMARMSDDIAPGTNLDSTFITCNPTTRVFGDYDADNLWVMCYHSIQARRPVPAVAPLGRMTI